MKINMRKRVLSCIVALLMVFAYAPSMAYANTSGNNGITVLDGQVKIVDTAGTATISDDVVTITAAGTVIGEATTSIVKIYNNGEKPIALSFDYYAENYGEFSETTSVNVPIEGSKTAFLNSDESIELSITGRMISGNNTAVLKLSNFKAEAIPELSNIAFTYDEAEGSVVSNDIEISSAEIKSVSYTEGIEVTAVPNDGVRFLGWINLETKEIYSKEPTYTIKPVKDMAVEAVFMSENTATYYLVGDRFLFTDFDKAMAKAEAIDNKTVVLLKDTTFTAGTYIVPTGVTMLIPFDEKNTLYTTKPHGDNSPYEEPRAYCTLTLEDGAELLVNGALSLSAEHFAARGKERGSGAPTGDMSFVNLKEGSIITVNNGASLYAYGYIVGDGTVTAKSGATVYELFQIEDFRGGGITTSIAYNNMDKGVLPISQYYVQNIEVPMTLEAGAQEYVYASLYLASSATANSVGEKVLFIGNDEAMFSVAQGSITKRYDGSKDRLIVESNGNVSLSSITVELEGNKLDSSVFELPINSNITVNINSGKAIINQDIALLPGSEISIEEGAECELDDGVSIYVYDSDQWGGFCGSYGDKFLPITYAPGKKYERTEEDLKDAAVKVNGTLNAGNGYIFSTVEDKDGNGGGANVYSTDDGIIKTVYGSQSTTYQFEYTEEVADFKEVHIYPVKLLNKNGGYIQTLDLDAVGTYTYKDGKWICDHEIDATKDNVTKEPTCTESGLKEVTCMMHEYGYGHTHTEVVPALGHNWDVADCEVPKTCTACGETQGAALGHDWNEATCTEPKTCEVCDKTEGTSLGHDWDEATCADPKTCGRCLETEGEALGHDWQDADCDTPQTCSVCKKTKGEPLGHIWNDATCDTAKTCDVCGATEGTALGHSYVQTVIKPTCTEGGYTEFECSVCGHSKTGNETDPLDHVVKDIAAKAATCTEAGHEAGTYCDRCGETLTGIKEVAALGHDYDEWVVDVEATCTEKGKLLRECKNCDAEETEVIYPTGHVPVIIDAVAATCTEDGLTYGVVCDVCGEVQVAREVVEAKGHTEVVDPAVEPTCTETGLTKGSHCDVCDEPIVAQQEVAALGHKYEAETVKVSCTEDGYTTYTCSVCEDTYTDDVIKAEGHKVVTDPGKAATCTEDGITEGSHCDVCGETIVAQETIEAPGHKLKHFDGKAATCTEAGYAPYEECEVCDYTTYEAIEATGHDLKEHVEEATCTTDGYTLKYCKCGYEEVIEGDKAFGHSFTEYEEIVKPTCTDKGKAKAACDHKCGAMDVKELDPAGHSEVIDPAVAATCTETGLTEGKHCEVCGVTTVEQKVTNKAPHKYGKEQYQKPTAEVDGGQFVKCECGDIKWTSTQTYIDYLEEVIPATTISASASADTKTETITVKWTKNGEEAVDSYDVYRSTSGEAGTWSKLETTSETSYVDKTAKPGTKYTYKIMGYRAFGDETFRTQETNTSATITKVSASYVKATSMSSTVSYASKGVKVTWTAPRIKVDGYQIYRATSSSGKYKLVKTAKASSKSWTNTGLKAGKKYYYKVRGYKYVNGKKTYTKFSSKGYKYVLSSKNYKLAKTIDKKDGITAKSAVKTSSGIKITWTKDSSVKCYRYKVYRSTSESGSYSLIGSTDNKYYTDKKAKTGKTYYYKIKGYRYFGKAYAATNSSKAVSGTK